MFDLFCFEENSNFLPGKYELSSWTLNPRIQFVKPVQKQPSEVFYKKGSYERSRKIHRKHLYQRFSFNKVAVLRTAKKRIWHRCFPVNLGQFLRTPFLQNTSGRLLRPVCKIVWIKPCLSDQWVLHICLCGVYSCSKYH